MNKNDKAAPANKSKKLTVGDLKKVIGGLGTVAPNIVEDNGGSKASPTSTKPQ